MTKQIASWRADACSLRENKSLQDPHRAMRYRSKARIKKQPIVADGPRVAPSEGERLLRRCWRRSGRSYRLVRRRSSRRCRSRLTLYPRCVLRHILPGTISWPEGDAERENGGDNNAADDHAGGGRRVYRLTQRRSIESIGVIVIHLVSPLRGTMRSKLKVSVIVPA